MHCGMANQIMGAVNFEEVKVCASVVILRNKSRGAQLCGIMEKRKAQDGKVGGHDCLIDSWIDKLYFWVPTLYIVGWGVPSVLVIAVTYLGHSDIRKIKTPAVRSPMGP
jgi:hypothetical protein